METARLKALVDEAQDLKERRQGLLDEGDSKAGIMRRIENASNVMTSATSNFHEWNDNIIRQLVDTVKVLSATKIEIILRGGISVIQELRVE